jgi:dihydroorotate dehydrogenase
MDSLYRLLQSILPLSYLHSLSLWYSKYYSPSPVPENIAVDLWDTHFRSPIGAAAGITRNGKHLKGLMNLGFGFIEVGSVCPDREYGKDIETLNENSVFQQSRGSNLGMMWTEMNLSGDSTGPRGVNIYPSEQTLKILPGMIDEEYCYGVETLYNYSDFIVLNISNTSHTSLDIYTTPERLQELIRKVHKIRDREIGLQVAAALGMIKLDYTSRKLLVPICVKIDADWEDWQGLIKVCKEEGIDGIVVAGTDKQGRAGEFIKEKATRLLTNLYKAGKESMFFIYSGGIYSGKDVLDKLKQGASLVEVYSCLASQGPRSISRLNKELSDLLKQEHIETVSSIIGSNFK